MNRAAVFRFLALAPHVLVTIGTLILAGSPRLTAWLFGWYDPIQYWCAALVGAQSVLLGIWAALGRGSFWIRLLGSIVWLSVSSLSCFALGMRPDLAAEVIGWLGLVWMGSLLILGLLRLLPPFEFVIESLEVVDHGHPLGILELLALPAAIAIGLLAAAQLGTWQLTKYFWSATRDGLPVLGVALLFLPVHVRGLMARRIWLGWITAVPVTALLLICAGLASDKPNDSNDFIWLLIPWIAGAGTLLLLRQGGYVCQRVRPRPTPAEGRPDLKKARPWRSPAVGALVAASVFYGYITLTGIDKRQEVLESAGIEYENGGLTIHSLRRYAPSPWLPEVSQFPNVRALNLALSHFHDEDLTVIDELDCLQTLEVGWTSTEGQFLTGIRPIPTLTTFGASRTQINDTVLRNLPTLFPNLVVLRLRLCPVADEAMKAISGLPRLRSLDIAGTLVSDEGLRHLHAAPSLMTVDISETDISGRAVMEFVAERYRRLQCLPELTAELANGQFVTIVDASMTVRNLSLDELLPFSSIDDGVITMLELSRETIDGDVMPWLAQFPSLGVLSLHRTSVNSQDLKVLESFASLHALLLAGSSEIDDSAVEILLRIPRLKYLECRGTTMTLEGVLPLIDAWRVDWEGRQFGPGRPTINGPGFSIKFLGTDFLDVTLDDHLDDAAVELIGDLPITELTLSGAGITDKSIEVVKGIPDLRFLYLESTSATAAGIDSLRQANPTLMVYD